MITCIIRELGRRYAIKFKELLLYSRKNVFELAETKKRIDNLKDRKLGFISFYDAENNDGFNLVGKEANDLISQYTNLTVVKNVKEIKGLVVSKGKVSGKVRLLSGARHFDSFREGEILVTAMTSPEFIVAMRKAKAIVTDEGGMTCHAAIVSRELGVPCIVATKIATRALTTGEMVEVDAEKGIIRKIK